MPEKFEGAEVAAEGRAVLELTLDELDGISGGGSPYSQDLPGLIGGSTGGPIGTVNYPLWRGW